MTGDKVQSMISAISADTLSAAVEGDLLTGEQAQALRDLESSRSASVTRDDEQFRFINGFSDIFVTIGLGLFLGAAAYFGYRLAGQGGMLIVAVASWLLAEYFTRRRRMALPSIALLLAFSASTFVTVAAWIDALTANTSSNDPASLVGAALVTVAAAFVHYRRFHVPITVAAAAGAVVVGTLRTMSPEAFSAYLTPSLLVCGLLVFALAMRFDLSDPKRQTRRTDIAFWLHMLAAPLIVHPLVSGFIIRPGGADAASAWGILGIFVVLALVAILVDRRAILVSGLSYAGIAFGTLVGGSGLIDSVVPLTMLVLGALVLLLSAGWRALRGFFLGLLPAGFSRWLPSHG
ncbi:hypothetical protein [Mesorhizobium sp. A623]